MKIYPQLFSATCLIALLASPLAQAQSTCTPEHAAMGHCTLDAPQAETPKPEESAKSETNKTESKPEAVMSAGMACTPEHAAMGHCTMDEPKADKPKKTSKAKKPKKPKQQARSTEKALVSEAKPVASTSTVCTPEHAAMGHCTLATPKAVTAKTVTKAKPVVKPMVPSSTACTPEHAAIGHCTLDTPKPAANIKPAAKPVAPKSAACTPEHAAMGHCTMDAPKKLASPATQPKPAMTCTPEHAAMGHCTMPSTKSAPIQAKPAQQPNPPMASTCTPEHAAMGHCTMPNAKASSQANTPAKPVVQASNTCTPEHAAMGHCTMDTSTTPAPSASMSCTPEHAAMGHCSMDTPSSAAPIAAKPASSCTPEHAAMGHCTMDPDLPVSDGSAATNIPMPYHDAMNMNDDPVLHKVMIDRFEVRDTQHGKPVILESDAWFGKSIDKLWLKTDLEAVDGDLEEAQAQVLYNRAISPFWDVQAGVRHDFKSVKRTWLALGVHGTAPYFIDTNAHLYLGKKGQAALNLSAEKEVMLTQKTVLIPELAVSMYAKDDHDLGVGSGLSDVNLGLRLSHEIQREFAPYVGVNWSKKFGKTADMAEHHGDKMQDTQFLIGIKAWF